VVPPPAIVVEVVATVLPWPSPPAQALPVAHHVPTARTSNTAGQRRGCLLQVRTAVATSPAPLLRRLPATCPFLRRRVVGLETVRKREKTQRVFGL
jgi:hypothetical protein